MSESTVSIIRTGGKTGVGESVLTVSKFRCPQNHPCPSIRVCPTGALTQKGFDAPEVDMDKCIRCAKCVRFCPMGAIALE